MKTDDPRVDLVVAILSVNNYPLEKTYSLIAGLHSEGLTDLSNLTRWTITEIIDRLNRAGYRRGVYLNSLLATRLSRLGSFAADMGIAEFSSALESTNAKALEQVLSKVGGIGPTVVRNFLMLRNLGK